MAEAGTFPAGQESGYFLPQGSERAVTYRVYASMERVQEAGPQPMVDDVPADSSRQQLLAAGDPALPGREPRRDTDRRANSTSVSGRGSNVLFARLTRVNCTRATSPRSVVLFAAPRLVRR